MLNLHVEEGEEKEEEGYRLSSSPELGVKTFASSFADTARQTADILEAC
jgi:hypothetical protein